MMRRVELYFGCSRTARFHHLRARRVTTDSDDRRMICSGRPLSSFEIARNRTRSLIHRSGQTNRPKWWTDPRDLKSNAA